MKNEPRNTRARCRPAATQQSARFRARRAPRLRRLHLWPEVQATLVSERNQPILSDDTTPTPHDQRNQLAAAAAQMALSKKTRGLYSPRTMQSSRREAWYYRAPSGRITIRILKSGPAAQARIPRPRSHAASGSSIRSKHENAIKSQAPQLPTMAH